MFICKEDLKSIFHRLEYLEDRVEDLRKQAKILRKQSDCSHSEFRGMRTYSDLRPTHYRICTQCEKVMGIVKESDYHQLEAAFHTRLSDKAQTVERARGE